LDRRRSHDGEDVDLRHLALGRGNIDDLLCPGDLAKTGSGLGVIEEPTAVDSPVGLQTTAPTPRVEHAVLQRATPPISTARRWWTGALALAVLITAGGLWLLYNDDVSFQSALRTRTTENESLQGQNLIIQGQLTTAQGNLTTAQADLAAAQAELAHPHLGIWNVRQSIQGPTYYLAAGVPDTFTYHLRLRSTGPMNVSIVSFDQFSLRSMHRKRRRPD
jgi:hypothetical protein